MAQCISKTKFAGVGALVQLVGVAVAAIGILFFGNAGLLVGGLLGLALLVIGSNMSKVFRCSDCGNSLDGRHIRLCPTCKTTIE